MLPGSLVCNGIENEVAIRDYWCKSYVTHDPICGAYQVPACSDLVENQTTACTLPHYSGAVNQSRTLVVLQTLGHLGQKLATIARKTLQRVKQVLKLDN
jgi:hypothetical protein